MGTPRLLLFLLLVALIGIPLEGTTAGESVHDSPASWTGWRGQSKHGRSADPVPTQWRSGVNIQWRTSIPGDGHSSPIVLGDHVYVSTAFPRDNLGQRLTANVLFGVSLLLAVLALRIAFTICDPSRAPGSPELAAAATLIATVGVLLMLVIAGEALLDYARCPVRSWLASSAFVSGCLALMLAGPRSRGYRIAITALAVLFATAVFAGVPAKDHSLRGGLMAVNSQVVLAAASIPLVPALAAGALVVPLRWRRLVLALSAGALIVCLPRFASLLITYRDSTLPVAEGLMPRLSLATAALPLILAVATAILWRSRPRSGFAIAAVVMSSAIAIAWMPFALLDQLAARSPYLTYHIGQPRFAAAFSPLLLMMGGGLLFVCTLALAIFRHSSNISAFIRPRTALAVLGPLMALLFFVRVNYLPTAQRWTYALVSVERASGKIAWIAEGLEGSNEVRDRRNSAATPTPVTDGEHVCAYYGNPGLMCTDLSGRVLWSRTDVPYESYYGAGFSPVLRDGVLVVAGDAPSGKIDVRGLDVRTGRDIWTRAFRGYETISGNHRTPILERQPDGRLAVVTWGRDYLRGLDLLTGNDLWYRTIHSHGDLVSGAVSDSQRLYLSSSGGTDAVAIRDLGTAGAMLWTTTKARSNCASPVLCNGLLVTVTDNGIVTALVAESGNVQWRHRLEGDFFSSPLSAGGAAYLTNARGRTTVLACEGLPRVISENDLDRRIVSSPAAAGGQLFLRADAELIAIAEPGQYTAARP